MQSSKKKNKTSIYRHLLGMTQQDAAKILKTGKSNIANMESEKHSPSEAYRKLLNLTPRELSSPVLSMGKALRKQNVFHLSVGETADETPYKIIHRKEVFEVLRDLHENFSDTNSLPEIKGEFDGTDVYIWKSEFEIPELNIKKDEFYPVMPRTAYKDGVLVLYRETLTIFKVATVSGNGTQLLSAVKNEPAPDICIVEIIGEILIK